MMLNIHQYHQKLTATVGLPPGTLLHIGKEPQHKVQLTYLRYNADEIQKFTLDPLKFEIPFQDPKYIHWIHLNGIHDLHLLEQIGQKFNIHSLLLEDIANTKQRSKVEDHDQFIFVILKLIKFNEETQEVKSDQVSFILGSNYLISFQEKEGDLFSHIQERLRKSMGKIRSLGADYLLYSLIDSIFDQYFYVLEKMSDGIEEVEEELIQNPTLSTMHKIQFFKRQVIFLSRFIWPLREVLGFFERGNSGLIQSSTFIYFRDVYDHLIHVIDSVEIFREMISGMLEIYLSSVNNKLNEIMKMLTIITTIFIPLSFIAGIYGMNFRFMPELGWRYGYFWVLGIMLMIFVGMIFYFKRKKWM